MIKVKANELLSRIRLLPRKGIKVREINEKGYDPARWGNALVLEELTRPISRFLETFLNIESDAYLETIPRIDLIRASQGLDAAITLVDEILTNLQMQKPGAYVDAMDYRSSAHVLQEKLRDFFAVFSPVVASHVGHEKQYKETLKIKEEVETQLANQLIALREEKEKAATVINAAENLGHLDEVIRVHRNFMWIWMGFLAIASVGTIVFLCWTFGLWPSSPQPREQSVSHDETAALIMLGLGKLVVASFAIGFCVICSRNYQNHVHNYIVNQHRKAAAITFVQMATNPSMSDYRSDLVRHAMEAIFAVPTTGFLSKFHNDFQSLNPVLNELVKKIGK